jgi:hypothetical protein
MCGKSITKTDPLLQKVSDTIKSCKLPFERVGMLCAKCRISNVIACVASDDDSAGLYIITQTNKEWEELRLPVTKKTVTKKTVTKKPVTKKPVVKKEVKNGKTKKVSNQKVSNKKTN